MHILNIVLLCIFWILIVVVSLILLLIAIILFAKLNLYARINNEELKVRFKIFCFTVFDSKKEMNDENRKQSLDIMDKVNDKLSKKNKNDDNSEEKTNSSDKNKKSQEYFSDRMNEKPKTGNNKFYKEENKERINNDFTKDDIFDIIKIGFDTLKKMVKRFAGSIKINKLYFNLLISTNDAAKTAILFGDACALYYPFLDFIKSRVKIYDDSTNIFVDYENKKTKVDVTCDISLRGICVIYILSPLLKFYIKYKRIKKRNKKGGAINE